jgi:hypothetical protein
MLPQGPQKMLRSVMSRIMLIAAAGNLGLQPTGSADWR